MDERDTQENPTSAKCAVTLQTPSRLEKWQAQLDARPTESEATRAVGDLLSMFQSPPQDPGGYTKKMVAALRQFPRDVALRCMSPYGVAKKTSPYIPSVPQAIEWCEVQSSSLAYAVDWERRAIKQRQETNDWEAAHPGPKVLPDNIKKWLDDMKERHLHGPKITEEMRTRMDETNRRFLERECIAAGMPADSQVSPSLVANVKAWKKDRAESQ